MGARARKSRQRPRFWWLWKPVKWAAIAVLGYLVACALLLVAYRFVDAPITTVQLQRVVEH
ncbi:MAG: hypothetical protein AAFQ53_11830, partial [Bacteroidota bacterium]